MQKTDVELRKIIEQLNITCSDRKKSAVMRSSIWNHFESELELIDQEIDVTKGESSKSIWDKLQNYLPIYTLFQSDRKNSDGDNEIQDPLKEAVKQILSDPSLQIKFNEIATEVEAKLKEVSQRTLEKLHEMNPEIADSLNPVIPTSSNLKWADVFKNVSITGDQNIPINKRGSGVKRLVLLNFFRAEAERRRLENTTQYIIYAIEEPETAQHTEHQKTLISAFKSLSNTPKTQVILTTHSATLVKELNFNQLRLITKLNGQKNIQNIEINQLPYPSLNEVNYLAFAEISEEYHNDLYGFIELQGLIQDYKAGKTTVNYRKIKKCGEIQAQKIVLTEYIRHQIHHPENTTNLKYTFEQLGDSINQMRSFVQISNSNI